MSEGEVFVGDLDPREVLKALYDNSHRRGVPQCEDCRRAHSEYERGRQIRANNG